jgi:molybdopterin molybdotransferase
VISVADALDRVLAGVRVTAAEDVGLDQAVGRVLAEDVVARVTQPPFPVSAMDGWAVRAADLATIPATLRQVGYAPAGGSYDGVVRPGETVRLFTGAPVPEGADAILIQEDADFDKASGLVTARETVAAGRYVRPAGLDFRQGDRGVAAGKLLSARDIGLAAAMNHPWLRVRRKPRIAILPTGDEIVRPGEPIGKNQIVSSNAFALGALVRAVGGEPVQLGIFPDDVEKIASAMRDIATADLLVTTGGASVGDHDLVRAGLTPKGLALDFWQIAMRPGKPLMFGKVAGTPLLGLPGNPVSTVVCALLFLRPMINAMLGLPRPASQEEVGRLGVDLPANDRRQDYLRSSLTRAEDGGWIVTPMQRQDSSMLSLLAAADALAVRPPHAPAAKAGDPIRFVRFDTGL